MLKYFDSNYWISEDHPLLNLHRHSDDEIKKEIKIISNHLQDNNISELIITNKLSYGYDWDVGNNKLMESKLIDRIENLHYCYVLTPDAWYTYDFNQYLGKAFKDGVRLFRLFPRRQLFYINDYYMKNIYKVLSEKKFPIMLDLKELDITGNKYFDIDVLEHILEENEDMPLILETTLKQCMFNRYYFPLLERYNNIYLEISGMYLIDQIEGIVDKYGSERLIFGTNYPNLPAEVNNVRMALSELNIMDKENIAFNNFNGIMGRIEIG